MSRMPLENIPSELIPPFAIQDKNDADRYWLPEDLQPFNPPPELNSGGWTRPDLIIQRGSLGNPLMIKARMLSGKKSSRVTIESAYFDNYLEAIENVYSQAAQLNLVQASPDFWRNEFTSMLDPDRNKISFHGPVFVNTAKVGHPKFVATITILGEPYESAPFETKMAAVKDVVARVNALAEPENLIKKPKPKKTKTALKSAAPLHMKAYHQPEIEFEPLAEQVKETVLPTKAEMQLLRSLVDRWRCEHSWLVSKPKKTLKDELRIFDLIRFLSVGDPLRWFEISHSSRNEAIAKIRPELYEHILRQSRKGQVNLLARYLNAMVKGKKLSPGGSVDLGRAWKDYVYKNGDRPLEVIDRLVTLKLLRVDSRSSSYSISNRAVTLVHNYLRAEFKPGSIGSVTPVETLFAMLKTGAVS